MVDALALGASGSNPVEVQVLSSAQNKESRSRSEIFCFLQWGEDLSDGGKLVTILPSRAWAKLQQKFMRKSPRYFLGRRNGEFTRRSVGSSTTGFEMRKLPIDKVDEIVTIFEELGYKVKKDEQDPTYLELVPPELDSLPRTQIYKLD